MSYVEQLSSNLGKLTVDWGSHADVSLYLDRCQVDTPLSVVQATWKHVKELRRKINKVIDFGAGDGRFSLDGDYEEYVGYEIDPKRIINAGYPPKAKLINKCAFSDNIENADLSIGNPPYVRNQDLPAGWRKNASKILLQKTGITISGLANAWQYFFLLSLSSVKSDGLCALVIPYEWVSRPSSKQLREYISKNNWNVYVYRLVDTTFKSVLTTSSITIVDKSKNEGVWKFFEETYNGTYVSLDSPSGSKSGVLQYSSRKGKNKLNGAYASRGLSPGTQAVFTLSEEERKLHKLRVGRDVVPCITTLRHVPENIKNLTQHAFDKYYKNLGHKCWLIKSQDNLSDNLVEYLNSIPSENYNTATCMEREEWWHFKMPLTPKILVATSFRGAVPKMLKNTYQVKAVGGVCGVYNTSIAGADRIIKSISSLNLQNLIVPHANGLRKVEINQMNTLLANINHKSEKKRDGK